jgi:hypothetical protein
LDDRDKWLLERCDDLLATRRKVQSVVVVAAIFVALLLFWILSDRPPRLLNWIFLIYVLITACERISYAAAIMAYKRLIRKLRARLESAEGMSLI